ncbi:alpha/beta fold hydrolase [Rhodococcoides fascians]|jgi:pimeloyl-ACP methyl ester carboxylesterase|uniref:alpha/beta fold hydrolase n=1 Tax=Rhodococcoides fascians TaxID=1828 RepID=UPI00050BE159|nr:alpha/beta fold hydrolase [Rhodococcus fascians]KMJ48737.1 hydrolase [Rhodococcus fascians]
MSASYELQSVELHKDVLRYVDVGDGPPVILVHGLLGSHKSWGPQIERLSDRYRVIAPDLFGHGDSDKPSGDYSLSSHAATIRDLMEYLNIDSAPLVGHSLGGGIVMQMTYLFPERVDRLVLVSSGGLGPEVSLLLKAATLPGSELVLPMLASDWFRRNTEGVLARLGKWGVPVEPGPSMAETWRSFRSVADRSTREAFLASTRAVVGPRGQTVSAKQHFEKFESIPSLLIWGGKDRMIPAKHADNIRREVPNSRVEIFPDAGHFPQLDEPDFFFRLLDEFLAANHTDSSDADHSAPTEITPAAMPLQRP